MEQQGRISEGECFKQEKLLWWVEGMRVMKEKKLSVGRK